MNSYEEFLQAIDELYDQNKLDFNNYKLLKKELETIEKLHEQIKTEYRNYFKMLESKIKNLHKIGACALFSLALPRPTVIRKEGGKRQSQRLPPS